MEFRIGSRVRPDYNTRVLWSKKKSEGFSDVLATTAANRDTVSISQKSTEQRLESVHKAVSEMDFSGKTGEEIYKSINDAYEDEFGYVGKFTYTDEERREEIRSDAEKLFNDLVPGYKSSNKEEFYYRAMGYDKMTNAEKINVINERIGGTSYLDKKCALNELCKAKVLTWSQGLRLHDGLDRKAGKEYCARNGLDYYTWSISGDPTHQEMKKFYKWCSETETSWLEVFDSVHDLGGMSKLDKDLFFEQVADVKNLLVWSDK